MLRPLFSICDISKRLIMIICWKNKTFLEFSVLMLLTISNSIHVEYVLMLFNISFGNMIYGWRFKFLTISMRNGGKCGWTKYCENKSQKECLRSRHILDRFSKRTVTLTYLILHNIDNGCLIIIEIYWDSVVNLLAKAPQYVQYVYLFSKMSNQTYLRVVKWRLSNACRTPARNVDQQCWTPIRTSLQPNFGMANTSLKLCVKTLESLTD